MSAPAPPGSTAQSTIYMYSTCEPKEGSWKDSIPLTDEKIGHFVFKNRVPGEPIDLVQVQAFCGWTEVDKCKVCTGGPFAVTWEVVLEWGDTHKLETISEVCAKCLNTINCTIVRNKNPEKKW